MDIIKIEILADGVISVKTDSISNENHVSADAFMETLKKLSGGTCKTKKRHGFLSHTHDNINYHKH